MDRELRQYKYIYSSPEMWLYWRDLLPSQSGSADCCWRKIVVKNSLSYSIVLFHSMVGKIDFPVHKETGDLLTCGVLYTGESQVSVVEEWHMVR